MVPCRWRSAENAVPGREPIFGGLYSGAYIRGEYDSDSLG